MSSIERKRKGKKKREWEKERGGTNENRVLQGAVASPKFVVVQLYRHHLLALNRGTVLPSSPHQALPAHTPSTSSPPPPPVYPPSTTRSSRLLSRGGGRRAGLESESERASGMGSGRGSGSGRKRCGNGGGCGESVGTLRKGLRGETSKLRRIMKIDSPGKCREAQEGKEAKGKGRKTTNRSALLPLSALPPSDSLLHSAARR